MDLTPVDKIKQHNVVLVNTEHSRKMEEIIAPSEAGPPCIGYRHLIAALGFFSVALINIQRMALAIAMTEMVEKEEKEIYAQNGSFPLAFNDTQVKREVFDWTSEEQGLVISVGFFGFAVPSLVAGRAAERFGAKRAVFGGNLLASICFLASPLASHWHVYAMISIQLLRGISQGFVLTGGFSLTANWAPRPERGFLTSVLVSGFFAGVIIGGLSSGYICFFAGWPFVFYIFGGIGVAYSLLFVTLAFETPKDHPYISKSELKYIINNQECDMTKKRKKLPWRAILTSIPVYAAMVGMIGRFWIVVYFMSVHPLYMEQVLKFPVHKNGMVSSLPNLLQIVGAWTTSKFGDWLYQKKYMTINKLRKTFDFTGCLGFSLCLLGIYFGKYDRMTNIICFTGSLFFVGASTPGVRIVANDMSPRYAGTLQGLMVSIAMLGGCLFPIIATALTKHHTLSEWHTVYFLFIAVEIATSGVFLLWGSGNVQPWNFEGDTTHQPKELDISNTNGTVEPQGIRL